MDKLISLIKDLVSHKFWGELVVKFEGGKVVLIEKREKIKP
jgi:hypothetical protein